MTTQEVAKKFQEWFMKTHSDVNTGNFQSGYYIGDSNGGIFIDGEYVLSLPISFSYGLFMEFFAENNIYPNISPMVNDAEERVYQVYMDYEDHIQTYTDIVAAMTKCIHIGIIKMSGGTDYFEDWSKTYYPEFRRMFK